MGVWVSAVSHPQKAATTSAIGCLRSGVSARSAALVDAVLLVEPFPYITGQTLHVDSGQIAGYEWWLSWVALMISSTAPAIR